MSSPRVLASWPASLLEGLWRCPLPPGLQLLLLVLPQLQPRRRKMRRRRSPRSRMTTWDSACLISLLPLQIKSFLHISEGPVTFVRAGLCKAAVGRPGRRLLAQELVLGRGRFLWVLDAASLHGLRKGHQPP